MDGKLSFEFRVNSNLNNPDRETVKIAVQNAIDACDTARDRFSWENLNDLPNPDANGQLTDPQIRGYITGRLPDLRDCVITVAGPANQDCYYYEDNKRICCHTYRLSKNGSLWNVSVNLPSSGFPIIVEVLVVLSWTTPQAGTGAPAPW